MQKQIKNDLLYLLRIIEYCEKSSIYATKFSTAKEFYEYEEQLAFNATLKLITQIGEQFNKISDELFAKYPELSKKIVIGTRNIIVHDYVGVNPDIIFEIVKSDLPQLKKLAISIINKEIKNRAFDVNELRVANLSPYLKHVDFSQFNYI